MTNLEEIPETVALDLARECLYRFLSAFTTDPYTPGWERIRDPQGHALAIAAADLLRDWAEKNPTPLTFGELPPEALDLRPLVADLSKSLDDLRADHDRVFGLIAPKECPPYETEYHPPGQTFLRSQQTADVAGFYHAFGLQPGGLAHERPDHIALELEFLALLLTKKRLTAADEENGDWLRTSSAGACPPFPVTSSTQAESVPVPVSGDTEVVQDTATDKENGDWLPESAQGACPRFPTPSQTQDESAPAPRKENGDWLPESAQGACPRFPTPNQTQDESAPAPRKENGDWLPESAQGACPRFPTPSQTQDETLLVETKAEHAEICDQAFRGFVQDHLAWWVPAFAAGLRRKADHGPYHALSNILAALIPIERARLGIAPPFQPVQPALIETPEEQSGCIGCS